MKEEMYLIYNPFHSGNSSSGTGCMVIGLSHQVPLLTSDKMEVAAALKRGCRVFALRHLPEIVESNIELKEAA